MININKLNQKLSTKTLNIEIMNYDFKFYKLKITNKNCKSFILKESYIPKKGYYKWIIEEVNKRKEEFLFNGKQNKKEYFDEYNFLGG